MLDLELIKQEALKAIEEADSKVLEELRIEYLSKKGKIQGLMAQMRELSTEEKPVFGHKVNDLKNAVSAALEAKKEALEAALLNAKMESEKVDISLDAYTPEIGSLHPLTLVQQELEDVFIGMGYNVAEGPELEQDLYNFTRANTPEGHPARDMQDTFYVDVNKLLRSQTTAIQMRVLEKEHDKLPIKVICPGKVYRRDDDDATHSHQFMQIEGLVIDKDISIKCLMPTASFEIDDFMVESGYESILPVSISDINATGLIWYPFEPFLNQINIWVEMVDGKYRIEEVELFSDC